MLGLAVLFGLGLWVVITCGAIWLGVKLTKKISSKRYTKYIGGLLGFMLTMGGFIVYWTIEYYQIQARVSYLCETEGGLKVFVTPEQWRREIGEKEWGDLPSDWKNISDDLIFKFNGKSYHGHTQLNKRIMSYEANDEIKDRVGETDRIYIDQLTQTVLFRVHFFSVGVPAIANSLAGLKFWINNIDDCYIGDWSYQDRFFTDNYSNRKILKDK